MYVKVSIPIFVFKTFTYFIPNKLIEIPLHKGQSINVPFRNKNLDAYIIAILKTPDFKGKILSINSINKNSFIINGPLWKTIEWISKYYCCPIGMALNMAIPFQHNKQYRIPIKKYICISQKGLDAIKNKDVTYKNQLHILNQLSQFKNKYYTIDLFKNSINSYIQVCKRLYQKGYVLQKEIEYSNGFLKKNNRKTILLTDRQKQIVNKINAEQKKNNNKPIVLSGLYGSGKILICIDIIKSILSKKQSVVFLVPEIYLIKSTHNILSKYFLNSIGIWHSKMKLSEKNYILNKIKKNQLSIIVSTRSGLLLPFKNIGLIIVDAEHESAYKQDANPPLYNGRDVAIIRSKFNKNPIMLMSTIPSLETYFNIQNNKFIHFHIEKKSSDIPTIKLVNMCSKENYKKNSGILSKILIQYIEQALSNNNQVILLQNRRGYSYIIKCSQCDYVKKCLNCSVPLKYHIDSDALKCHYCSYMIEKTNLCENCNSNLIELSGTGTQKLESTLRGLFPNKTIIRYDQDTMKNNSLQIMSDFKSGKGDILIGTQIITKSLNFKNVALVGIINADIGLYSNDFRAGEKIFQLIYQIIGRTSKNKQMKTAIIQSFNPTDLHIKYACQFNIDKMYKNILKERQELSYPPYSRLIRLMIMGKNKKLVKNEIQKISLKLNENNNLTILGPSLSPIEKINNQWRYHLIIKSDKKYWLKFYFWINTHMMKNLLKNKYAIKFDVDPISLL